MNAFCFDPKSSGGGYGREVGTTLVSSSWKEPPMVTTNSNGEHSMPTISADEYKMTQAQKDHGGGYIVHREASTSSCTRPPRRSR